MVNVGIVILARFNSSRLPGKALRRIKGKPVLYYIIERIKTVVDQSQIIIATSDQQTDDVIAEFAKNIGIRVFRGDLDNVAQRFYLAGRELKTEYIARINGDNIFLDSEVLEEMIEFAKSGKYLFLSNVKNRTYPKGMSIEIVQSKYYQSLLGDISKDSEYYEHVTSYLYSHEEPEAFKYFYNTAHPDAAGLQIALDTEEDFMRSVSIINHFKKNQQEYNLTAILDILKLLR